MYGRISPCRQGLTLQFFQVFIQKASSGCGLVNFETIFPKEVNFQSEKPYLKTIRKLRTTKKNLCLERLET